MFQERWSRTMRSFSRDIGTLCYYIFLDLCGLHRYDYVHTNRNFSLIHFFHVLLCSTLLLHAFFFMHMITHLVSCLALSYSKLPFYNIIQSVLKSSNFFHAVQCNSVRLIFPVARHITLQD